MWQSLVVSENQTGIWPDSQVGGVEGQRSNSTGSVKKANEVMGWGVGLCVIQEGLALRLEEGAGLGGKRLRRSAQACAGDHQLLVLKPGIVEVTGSGLSVLVSVPVRGGRWTLEQTGWFQSPGSLPEPLPSDVMGQGGAGV